LIETKTGLKIIGYWGGSTRNVLSTKKPVNSIEDLKGFRLRLISSPLKVNAWKAVGTVPTPIAFMETYLAMKSGVVDGMENESVAVREMKFYEPVPFIARTEHEFTVRPLFISKKTFDKLSPDLQQIVLKSAQEATAVERSAEAEAGVAAEAEMQTPYLGISAISFAAPMIFGMVLLAYFAVRRAFEQPRRLAVLTCILMVGVVAVLLIVSSML
jgi:TRAP-type C4-dicarboxylate transport system substrate-binding protein